MGVHEEDEGQDHEHEVGPGLRGLESAASDGTAPGDGRTDREGAHSQA